MIGKAAVAVVAAVGAVAVLGACSSSSDGNPPPAPTTVTSTETATAGGQQPSGSGSSQGAGDSSSRGAGNSSSPTGGPSSSATSQTSGSGETTPQPCLESQLRATLDPRPVRNSDRDKDYALIVDFQNTSTTACTLHGYPGAALVDAGGKQVKQAQRTIRGRLLGLPTSTTTVPTVVVQPEAYASAGLEGVSTREAGAAQAGCDDSYPRILVTPPNTRTAVPFTVKWPICSTFTVHPTNTETNPPA